VIMWKTIGISALAVWLWFPCTVFSQENKAQTKGEATTSTFLYPIKFFQQYISGADGDRCAMHPSCSSYAAHAFRKHGAFWGWIMTCDRLMRCGRDEVLHSSPVWKDNVAYSYDPLENNDFWWDRGK